MENENHIGKRSTRNLVLTLSGIALCIAFAALLVSLVETRAEPYSNNERTVVAHYHKDVDCTITDIDARWCVFYWKVDVEYENAEYGLSAKQTLTGKDGADFHDAIEGEHIAAVLLSDVDNKSGEVLNRTLGNIVISAGHDKDSVRLR